MSKGLGVSIDELQGDVRQGAGRAVRAPPRGAERRGQAGQARRGSPERRHRRAEGRRGRSTGQLSRAARPRRSAREAGRQGGVRAAREGGGARADGHRCRTARTRSWGASRRSSAIRHAPSRNIAALLVHDHTAIDAARRLDRARGESRRRKRPGLRQRARRRARSVRRSRPHRARPRARCARKTRASPSASSRWRSRSVRPIAPRRTATSPKATCSRASRADAKREALAALEIAPSFERAQDLLLKAIDGGGRRRPGTSPGSHDDTRTGSRATGISPGRGRRALLGRDGSWRPTMPARRTRRGRQPVRRACSGRSPASATTGPSCPGCRAATPTTSAGRSTTRPPSRTSRAGSRP